MAETAPKIGLMCGTFDPPHIGHLILAQTALNQLSLDKVLFLPVGDPTHKTTHTAASLRLEMTKIAIADNADFELDKTDAMRPEPHYTATLLPLLVEKHQSAQLWLLVGGDSLTTFPDWYQPAEILRFCRLAVLNRPGWEPDMPHLNSIFPNLDESIDWLEGPFIHLSSSWLRQSFHKEQPLQYFLPDALVTFIKDNRLYG